MIDEITDNCLHFDILRNKLASHLIFSMLWNQVPFPPPHFQLHKTRAFMK